MSHNTVFFVHYTVIIWCFINVENYPRLSHTSGKKIPDDHCHNILQQLKRATKPCFINETNVPSSQKEF